MYENWKVLFFFTWFRISILINYFFSTSPPLRIVRQKSTVLKSKQQWHESARGPHLHSIFSSGSANLNLIQLTFFHPPFFDFYFYELFMPQLKTQVMNVLSKSPITMLQVALAASYFYFFRSCVTYYIKP